MAELTRQQLEDLATSTNIPDNTTELIDPAEVRNQYANERDSVINKLSDGIEVLDIGGRKVLKYSNPQTLEESNSDALISKAMAGTISSGSIVINPATPYMAINKSVILWDCTTGNKEVQLPQSSLSINFKVTIKKTDSSNNFITVTTNGTETIDGQSEIILNSQYDSVTLYCSGVNWFII